MIDVRRLRGIALAVAAVAVTFGAVDFLLTVALGPVSQWLTHDDNPADRWVIRVAGSRLAGAVRELRGAGAGSRLGLLLGQSSLELAVDPEALDAEDGLTMHWLSIYGEGGSVHKIAELSDLVDVSGLRPDVVVLALNSTMIAGTGYREIRASGYRATRNWIKPWIWTWENRTLANLLAQVAIHHARVNLFKRFGQGVGALFEPDRNPWRVLWAGDVAPRRLDDTELRDRLEYYRSIGWLDPAYYGRDRSNAVVLRELIRHYQAEGAEVLIVLLPLHSVLRTALPPEAHACVEDAARSATSRPVSVIDLESSEPDTMFNDLHHLKFAGRVAFSRALAAALARELAGGSPPRSSR